jgi:hypothetical protein
MANEKPYKAKSLKGAEREVRNCRKIIEKYKELLDEAHRDRIQFAKLAADGPCFDNPIIVAEAKARRDEVLKRWCNLKPNGTWMSI